MPWYRQFWPWFLISLPATAVIAGISTVFIAAYDPDGLVVSDYYRQGLAINQNRERQRAAEKLGLAGRLALTLDDQGRAGMAKLNISNADGARLADFDEVTLRLVHPTRAHKDINAPLYKDMTGALSGPIMQPGGDGRWRVVVEPPDGAWRLTGELALPAGTVTALTPG